MSETIYIYDGDKVELNGTTYIADEGVLIVLERDERTEVEKRLDDIEDRLEKLENPPWTPTITYPPDDHTMPDPFDLYVHYPDTP